MKKSRNRQLATTTDENEEILDSYIDYCMSDEDPELRGRPSRYNRSNTTGRCDAGGPEMSEFIGAFAARLVLPSACGPQPSFQKSRTTQQKEYLYNQVLDERLDYLGRQSRELNRRHPRDTGVLKNKPVRKERKPSGIMSNRSADFGGDVGDDWDTGLMSHRTNVRDQVVLEGNEDEETAGSNNSFVIRVRSRESLVSELTELVPHRGMLRKPSGRSERALSGMESVSQSSVSHSKRLPQSRRPAISRRGGKFSSRRQPGSSLKGVYSDDFESSVHIRDFRSDSQATNSREAVLDRDTAHNFHVKALQNNPSQFFRPDTIPEEQSAEEDFSMENSEMNRNHRIKDSASSNTRKNGKQSSSKMDAHTFSNGSKISAFIPVEHGGAIKVSGTPPYQGGNPRVARTSKELSDRASQQTSSSDSTTRRRNHAVKQNTPASSCEKSKCDTAVSSTSGIAALETQLQRPNPCVTSTPLIGGLLACTRGNKAERMAAEREELRHILVYEPTPRSNGKDFFTSQKPISKKGPVSPLTVVTDATSLGTSQESAPTPNMLGGQQINFGSSEPKPSLLLERRKAALRTKVSSGAANDTETNPYLRQATGDARDVSETKVGTDDKRDMAPTVTFSDDEGHPIPPPAENKETSQQGTINFANLTSQMWPFSGVNTMISSDLEELAPLGQPKSSRGARRSPGKSNRISRYEWRRDKSPRRSRSPRKSKSPPPTRPSDTFSEYGTELTSSPSMVMSREGSAYTGWTSNPQNFSKAGSIYERKRMASRETFPIFHWQAGIDENSVAVMSLDYK